MLLQNLIAYKWVFIFTCLFLASNARSQIFPAEKSHLHYVIIGFTFPSEGHKGEHTLEIAKGSYYSESDFAKHIVVSVKGGNHRMIAEVPSFGSDYTWRVVFSDGSGPMHHFSTQTIDDVNPDSMRLRVKEHAKKYKDAYFFTDINRTLYDMKGRPVWFIPQTNKLKFEVRQVRDLKMTDRGTITFIIGGHDAYEINYNGDILWKAPKTKFQGFLSEDTTERYNHELTRLSNGHYMVLNSEFVWSDPNVTPPKHGEMPPMPKPEDRNKPVAHPLLFGTLLEYDEMGNTIWSWKSAPYFQHRDIATDRTSMQKIMDDVHQNSFYFDEKNRVVYLSYKNLHRIIKVSYPGGDVTGSYGEQFQPGMQGANDKLFCYQHSVKISDDGLLYLFDNNSCHPDKAPEILMLKEPAWKEEKPKVAWEYEFPVAPLAEIARHMPMPAANGPGPALSPGPGTGKGDESVGGNIVELPGHSMFASLCSPYGDLFIVNKDKIVLWHAVNEKWSARENRWLSVNTYRANIIPRRVDLDSMILAALPH